VAVDYLGTLSLKHVETREAALLAHFTEELSKCPSVRRSGAQRYRCGVVVDASRLRCRAGILMTHPVMNATPVKATTAIANSTRIATISPRT
jgi:hypothetical protein